MQDQTRWLAWTPTLLDDLTSWYQIWYQWSLKLGPNPDPGRMFVRLSGQPDPSNRSKFEYFGKMYSYFYTICV